MTNPIIGMLHNLTTNRFHPILFLYNPLPSGGPPDRHKSKGHHTAGFDTRDAAEAFVNGEMSEYTKANYGEPKLTLEKMFPWDGVETPAMVIFFGESEGKVVPMFQEAMAKIYQPLTLEMGKDKKSPSSDEIEQRIAELRLTVHKYLPQFADQVHKVAPKGLVEGNARLNKRHRKEAELLLHQDAFASAYDIDEYTLLGMFVKFAGLYGVAVHIIGDSHETF